MLKKRTVTSNILDQDNLDLFVQDIYTKNKKVNKRVEVCTNLHIYQQQQLFILKKRHNKTIKDLFIKKLQFDSLDILYKIVEQHVNKILNKFARFMLYIFNPSNNYKKYPHLCILTHNRLSKYKSIPRKILLINKESINRFLR